ncbi:MAG: hypothetical protein M1831_004360 [Alyxoria varia]|nr:MAG: hypothetical protein M1831_004360 [Alyxoria varia]
MPPPHRPPRDYDSDFDDDLPPPRNTRRPRRNDVPPLEPRVRSPPPRMNGFRGSRSPSSDRLTAPSSSSDSDETVFGEYVRHGDGKIDYMPKSSRRSRRKKFAAREEKDRERSPMEQAQGVALPVAGALAGATAGYAASHSRDPVPPRGPGPKRYDDDEDDRPPPRSRKPRRPPPDMDRDRDYDSDAPRRAPRWYPDDDDRSNVGPRPSRRPPPRRPPPRPAYDDPRYDDRFYDDEYPPRRPRRRRASYGDRDRPPGRGPPPPKGNWKKQARDQGMGMFKEHAVPVIRREGGRIVTQELGKFLAKQAK